MNLGSAVMASLVNGSHFIVVRLRDAFNLGEDCQGKVEGRQDLVYISDAMEFELLRRTSGTLGL